MARVIDIFSCRDIKGAFRTYFLSVSEDEYESAIFPLSGIIPFLLAACGGGGCSTPPPPSKFTIGGTVMNLAGTNGGLQLADNGSGTLNVNANGAFTFATAIDDGSAYAVTISMQPSNPAQTCAVTNGSGTATATANVTNIMVDCGHNEWTWMGGSNLANQIGTYGTVGTPNPSNVPGARRSPGTWIDAQGNLWLFGGSGYDATGTFGDLNDLWEYEP